MAAAMAGGDGEMEGSQIAVVMADALMTDGGDGEGVVGEEGEGMQYQALQYAEVMLPANLVAGYVAE